jgi:hypothetical protein
MGGRISARNFGGRPAEQEPKPGRQGQMSVVLPLPLKRKIERAAAKNGWSVSNEARHRLELSFALIEQAGLSTLFGLFVPAELRELLGLPKPSGGLLGSAEEIEARLRRKK